MVKVLDKAGFRVIRQKGSHLILAKNEYVAPHSLAVLPESASSSCERSGILRKVIQDADVFLDESGSLAT